MDKESILDHLDFRDFYRGFVPSLTGNPQAHGHCPLPGHEDKRASFSVNLDTGLFKCHGCGRMGDVFTFHQELKGVDFKTTLEEIARMAGTGEITNKRIVATYPYTDEAGNLLYEVVRYEPKAFLPRHKGANGDWIWKMEGVRRVLYNLPEVIKAECVILVEGEKDVESLKALGYTGKTAVSTSQGGANGWRAEFADCLAGKSVAIIPDNDRPGHTYAETVARSLQGKAKAIRIVELSGLGERQEKHGLDVSDWIGIKRKEGKVDVR